jgi:hypothetical protein
MELRTNRVMGKAVVDFLVYEGRCAPGEVVKSALNDLHVILDDTERLLREAFPEAGSLGASRLPRNPEQPLPPKGSLEVLQTTLDLMQIEVEMLLRQPWATDEEYQRISSRRDFIIKLMGYMARYYKISITSRAPEAWTVEVEKKFEKFLKIKG